MKTRLISCWTCAVMISAVIPCSLAQAPLQIYTDTIVNGFQDWSSTSHDTANTTLVHSGARSILVNASVGGAVAFHQNPIDTVPYGSFSFWANGGDAGGQLLQVYATLDNTDQAPYTTLAALAAGSWQQITIPLSALNAANKTNLTKISIQLRGGATGGFYLDDIQLNARPAPATAHLSVDSADTLRMADTRWFGVNTATWDSTGLNVTSTLTALAEAGITTLRWPGGSTSDAYHWASDLAHNVNFVNVATNLRADVFVTVNYGSGTSNEAAAWVSWANITNSCGFKYWEIGNECYGSWEVDLTASPHDPYTYAVRAAGYMQLMKMVDPTIKVGVVAVPGEDSYGNLGGHYATNSRTGDTHYGWTPVMLDTFRSMGVTPDFLVHHVYPQYTPTASPPPVNDSDALVLQASRQWALDAADLRQQILDYMGPVASSNIELTCTENNSDSGAQGRQSTSIVNALYLADSLGQLMKTEFNSFLWWDLRNGTDLNGSFDPSLYGWRSYGDLGMINGTTRHPTFYAEKLMQYFVRPGDTVLNAHSDYLLLPAYAARKADGSVAVLVINKDLTTNLTAQLSISNFFTGGTAVVRSYGIAQDEAARLNDPTPGAQDISSNVVPVGAVFTNVFPAGTLTLIRFMQAVPLPPVLAASLDSAGNFILQVQDVGGTPYKLQTSTNLAQWTSVLTNSVPTSNVNYTSSIPAGVGVLFWRATTGP